MIFRPEQGRERVGLFGGSFNPPHIGHTAICRWLFSRGLVDRLWAIPCYVHPLDKQLAPFHHRMVMCQLAFNKLMLPIDVLDVEKRLGGVSMTLRTIEHLKRENPGRRFVLITGSDVSAESDKWHQFEKIREEVDIVRIPRGPKSPIPDVSSTDVRQRIVMGESYSDLVEKEIAVYIVTKGLYR